MHSHKISVSTVIAFYHKIVQIYVENLPEKTKIREKNTNTGSKL